MLVRTFISIAVPTNDEIMGLLDKLHDCENVSPTNAEQLHLTLKFIGDVDDSKLEKIERCVELALAGIEPFEMELKSIGTFPAHGDPRIVWAGTKSDMPLEVISASLGENLRDASICFDNKPFKPHITLGRISGKTDLTEICSEYRTKSLCRFECDHVDIMKSTLGSGGAVHSLIQSVRL